MHNLPERDAWLAAKSSGGLISEYVIRCGQMRHRFKAVDVLRSAAAFSGVLMSASVLADIALSPGLDFVGDLRGGYYSAKWEDRDGSNDAHDQLIGRIRGGLNWKPSGQLAGTVRLAGRYSTQNNHSRFEFFDSIPDADGLRAGDSTVDELFLKYTP